MTRPDSDAAVAKDPDSEIYASLREYEQHFNGLQVETKKLASAWMLGVFGAIAFIIRGDLKAGASLLDTGLLLVVIGAGANIGLLSLWILDQKVQQRLLSAAFDVGLLLERHNPALPPIRSKMWLNSRSKGVGRYNALFYASPMGFIAAAAIYGLALSNWGPWWLVVGALVAVAAFTLPFWQWLDAERTPRKGAITDNARYAADRWEKGLAARESAQSSSALR